MKEEYYKRIDNCMTTYYGRSYSIHNKPAIAINGTNFELTKKICNKCVHSVYHHDSTPPICRIGLCSLPYEDAEQSRINNASKLYEDVPNRFLFIVNRFENKLELSRDEKSKIISDNRLLIIRDNTLCYSVAKYNCLYRIKDVLIFQLLNDKQAIKYANVMIKERDNWVKLNTNQVIQEYIGK